MAASVNHTCVHKEVHSSVNIGGNDHIENVGPWIDEHCDDDYSANSVLNNQTPTEPDHDNGGRGNAPEDYISPRGKAPDGGYGWIVVLCCLIILTIYSSDWVIFSIYNTDFCETFDKPLSQISIIGSLDAAVSQLAALPSGALVSVFGCRPVCVAGLLVCASGLFLSAFATSFSAMILTFGFIKSIGVGMLYVPGNILVQQYFTTRRPLAAGITTCGLSLGPVLGPVHRLLISTYGWRGALIIHAGVVLQVLLCALLMKPLRHRSSVVEYELKSSQNTLKPLGGEHSKRRIHSKFPSFVGQLRKRLMLAMFRDPRFPLFLAVKGFSICGLVAMYKFSVARAVSFGIPKLPAATLVICNSIASTLARTIGGVIANIKGVNRLLMYGVCTMLGGVVVILSIVVSTELSWHVIFQISYGVATGLSDCLLPTIAADLFTLERLPTTLGWLPTIMGVVALIHMPIFGVLHGFTSSFNASYIFSGVMQIVGGLCAVVIIHLQRKRKK